MQTGRAAGFEDGGGAIAGVQMRTSSRRLKRLGPGNNARVQSVGCAQPYPPPWVDHLSSVTNYVTHGTS